MFASSCDAHYSINAAHSCCYLQVLYLLLFQSACKVCFRLWFVRSACSSLNPSRPEAPLCTNLLQGYTTFQPYCRKLSCPTPLLAPTRCSSMLHPLSIPSLCLFFFTCVFLESISNIFFLQVFLHLEDLSTVVASHLAFRHYYTHHSGVSPPL